MIAAITSSKGGAGKTLLTCVSACGIFDKTDLKVIVVDIDPQHTIEDIRKDDVKLAKSSSERTKLYKTSIKNNEKNGMPFFAVTSINLNTPWKKLKDAINSFDLTYDLVMLDFPGSLNLHDNCLRLLTILDFVFIPFTADKNTRKSSLKFIRAMNNLKREGKISADWYVFFNEFHDEGGKNGFEFQELDKSMKKAGIPMLENVVYEDVNLERYSTIVPERESLARKNIYHWIGELYMKMFNKKL